MRSLGAIGLALATVPVALLNKETEDSHDYRFADNTKKDSEIEPLQCVNHKAISDKYLHEDIKKFIVVTEWHQEPFTDIGDVFDYDKGRYTTEGEDPAMRPKARPDLRAAYMGTTVEGLVSEESIKKFCEAINRAYELGVIEYGAITQSAVYSLKLSRDRYSHAGGWEKNALPERHILFFHPCSKYTVKEQRSFNGRVFNREGELPPTETI